MTLETGAIKTGLASRSNRAPTEDASSDENARARAKHAPEYVVLARPSRSRVAPRDAVVEGMNTARLFLSRPPIPRTSVGGRQRGVERGGQARVQTHGQAHHRDVCDDAETRAVFARKGGVRGVGARDDGGIWRT